MAKRCPFSANPIPYQDFTNRQEVLKRVASRLVGGQSTAIVGEPRIGKTSFLLYLATPEVRQILYGDRAEHMLFSYLDTQVFGRGFTQAKFWERALGAVKEHLVDPEPDASTARQYRVCQENNFGSFVLEQFFGGLGRRGWQLILLIDEFDHFLHHPILNCGEFFGSLRHLASTNGMALSLVIASRLSLSRLNKETQRFNPTGSPYFNIFTERVLGDFADEDARSLLSRANDRFTDYDRWNIRQLAGGHPFLLQAAATSMWDAYDDGLRDSAERRRYVSERLFTDHRQYFAETWRNWTPETRQAFTVVALSNTEKLLANRRFHLESLLRDLVNWQPELRDLEAIGLLQSAPSIPGGWLVTQGVMLAWLADELSRAIRDDSAFSQWLRAAELEGRWTRGQREQVKNTAQGFGDGALQLLERLFIAAGAGFGMGAS